MSGEGVSEFDVEELVRGMHSLSDDVDVIDFIGDKYQISWDDFCQIIRDLMPLIAISKSALTEKVYRGFGNESMFFIKQEISNG